MRIQVAAATFITVTAGLLVLGLALPASAHHHSEAMQNARKLQFIDRYDQDGDLQVSSIEFEQSRRERFDITDEDSSGSVSEEEYVYEWEDRLDKQLEIDRAGQVRQTNVRFGAMDRDDNGEMSWEEYQRSADRMFARQDTNEDGVINEIDPTPERRQWSGDRNQMSDADRRARQIAWASAMLRMPSTHTLDGVLEKYDTDGDSAVTRAEFDAKRRVDFDRTDEDSNGTLNADEYLAEYEDRLDRQIARHRKESVAQAGRRFDALDEDDDQIMTFREYQNSGHRMFARMDTTSDGYVADSDPLPPPRQLVADGGTNSDDAATATTN